jgi:hypothetical protein
MKMLLPGRVFRSILAAALKVMNIFCVIYFSAFIRSMYLVSLLLRLRS